jgi:hypothetical protein
MTFQGVIEEVMSMLQAEETATATASSSTRRPKRRRRYINRDREAAHFRLRRSYFRRRYRMRRTLFPKHYV